ncbi:HAD family phosphatase [Streptomyces sp. TLI_146]|uniref:HAD family hydrolase n=1 Tax=Streptomyces sp. TLI_146 TaxID=1938858 RepID=UPI000C70D7A1|nr:HAD family phosphatase [Streptomyces sp. TLI_146]PKV90094.1 HAD superfamily hydrolase (TIGR01493 family)/HAD superfamily hydrolase (TIGR01509 family) [Streptomyces sp. TLI_146]
MSESSATARTADLAPLMKVTPPAAVVFDCDGTLMDTEPCADAARGAVFARRGHVYDDAARDSLVGLSVTQAGEVMARLFRESALRLTEELAQELLAAVADGAQPMPGAADVVAILAARVPVAVASNGPRVLMDKSLAQGGLSRWLPITVSGDDVATPKPHPACYLAACAALGVEPGSALAVEDSPVGARAAHAAGMTVLGVGTLALGPYVHAHVPALDDAALHRWLDGW